MTNTQKYIESLPADTQQQLTGFFGSVDAFYQTIYLMVQNGHMIQENKPDQWERRLETVKHYQELAEKYLNTLGLNGKDLVADIASDYFEDYVHYREQQFPLTQEQFISNIQKLSSL